MDELPKDRNGTPKTPAASPLFITNQECKKLLDGLAHLFHHLVVKLLYLCRCTRQDIQMVVDFICTRVKNPDMDNYKNLMCIIQYLSKPRTYTDHRARWPPKLVGGQTDKISKGELKLAFCPTQDILADFLTNPLQGALFVLMREKILPKSAWQHKC